MKKRVLSLLLVLVMILGMLPTGVLAAEEVTDVSNQETLAGMTDGSYSLTQDIVLTEEWAAMDFSGTLDGNGHTITLNGQPLFDEMSGSVQNLLLDGSVSARTDIGALAFAVNSGTVNNCWSGVSVKSASYDGAAGFAATVTGGTIKNCLFTGSVSGYPTRGIAVTADAESTISNCYWVKGNSASNGSFTGQSNQQITADDYPTAMANLNAAHEDGLLYWVTGEDGVPKPTVSESEMKDAIATAKTEGSDAIVIAPQITGEATKVTAEVPTQSLKDVVKNTDAALEVQTDVGSVSIPNDALDAIAQEAGGSTVTITVETKDAADLKDQVSAAQLEGATVVDVTITSSKKELTTFGGESLTITIPVTGSAFVAGESYKVIVIGADSSRENVIGTCIKENGKLSVQVKLAHVGTFVVTTQKAMPFTDVTGHWAAEAIAWAYGNDLMNGTGETTFAPNTTLNRAMLATILYRMAGSPAGAGEGSAFTDVALDTWYAGAVAWANENGIVSGMGDGTFAPLNAITRQQLAAMLYRYAQYSKLDTSAKGDLSKFTDGGQVSSWASDAMAWAVGTGLISGKTADTLDPTGTATRAEVATILMRFSELAQ